MRISTRALVGALALATAAGVAAQAQAAYFVRPYVQQGVGVVDGFQNGASSGGVNFGTQLVSNVDMQDGSIKTYLEITGPDAGGPGFGQALGVFGPRITFDNALGETVSLSFDFDGHILAPEWNPALNSTMQIGITANLWVYDASAGANNTNFTSLGGALISQSVFRQFNNPADGLDDFVSQGLSGAFDITSGGRVAYDVFVSFGTFISMNNNPGTVTMDFMNTATLDIQTTGGAVFTSDSGALLGSAQTMGAVPEPGTWALMIGGFGLTGGVLRRRRAATCA